MRHPPAPVAVATTTDAAAATATVATDSSCDSSSPSMADCDCDTNAPMDASADNIITVCTGSEWYQFPSNFFLPAHAHIQYIEDGFRGILPQHFAAANGTSAAPEQPFNDRNREEPSRYVELFECDYLVALVDFNRPMQLQNPLRRMLMASGRGGEGSNISGGSDTSSDVDGGGGGGGDDDDDGDAEDGAFQLVLAHPVISQEFSPSALARAFFVPLLTPQSVKSQLYGLYRNEYKF